MDALLGIEAYNLSEAEHDKAISRLKLNVPENYEAAYHLAVESIQKYRLEN